MTSAARLRLTPDEMADLKAVAAAQAVASGVRHLSQREAGFERETLYKAALDFGLPTTIAHVEGAAITVHAPIIGMSKAEIIAAGTALGVDYGMTVSCYQADSDGRACGRCDSCRLRAEGFAAAGIADPTRYQT